MKFVFLALSRRTKRKIKVLLLFLAFFSGVFAAAESRYAIMRVSGIDVLPRSNIIPPDSVWGVIPEHQAKLWPLLLLDKIRYEEEIEKRHPVTARLKLAGWGRFRVNVEPLEPLFKFYWDGKFWYVSDDGRIWLVAMEDNKTMNVDSVADKPVLTWSGLKNKPVDFAAVSGSVYKSSLPMINIIKWYENIDYLGWSKRVKYVQAGRREGRAVVMLVFKGRDGKDGLKILFSDDPAHWREAGLAIKKIYPDIAALSSDMYIDTTYKDKILVRNRVQ